MGSVLYRYEEEEEEEEEVSWVTVVPRVITGQQEEPGLDRTGGISEFRDSYNAEQEKLQQEIASARSDLSSVRIDQDHEAQISNV